MLQNLPFMDLPGPKFLDVFGALAIMVFAGTFLAIYLADRTDRRRPPPVPQTPDAMEIAFLKGGVNQVIRTIVYDLVQRGYATLAPDDRIGYTAKKPAPGELNALEARVLESIQATPKAHELFANRTARAELLAALKPVRARLAAEELVKPDRVKRARTFAQAIGVSLLVGFAGLKIYVAETTGHPNVWYLVFLCGAAVAGLFVLAYVMTRHHASRRGRAWLDAMALAWRPRLDEALREVGAPGPVKAFEGASLFLIGLYGFSVLKGTPEAAFANHFKRASGDGGGSCGSSCGGSCGSGDGGGGCGGCGGGGD
jgi:uncharacterized protein (TIGR04222 family)